MNLMENMGLTPKENKREIKLIQVGNLSANSENFYDTNDIEELKQSILLAGGVRQNLIVQPNTSCGGYTIISGHRRYKAVMELLKEGYDIPDKLPCEIETDPDMADLLLITTNSTTRRLTDWERVEQFERLEKLYEKWKAEGKTTQTKRDTLAQMLGDSRTGIARIQAISNNLSPILLGCLQNGILGISVAYEASKLTQEQQEEFYHKCCASGQFDLNSIRKMVQKEITAVEADKAEQTTIEDYTDGDTIKQQTGVAAELPEERREFIPLKKWTGCEILLKTRKIGGEYVTIVQYRTPEHSGERNIGRYPNIPSARAAAIQKVKDIDNHIYDALIDAGLIKPNGVQTYQDMSEKEEISEYEDMPDEAEEPYKTVEPDETVEDFIERVKKMRHSRTYYTRDRSGNIEINNLGCNALLDIGESDRKGMPIKELDIVEKFGKIGVIVYKSDEFGYGIAIIGKLEHVDVIPSGNVTVIGNVLKNQEILFKEE